MQNSISKGHQVTKLFGALHSKISCNMVVILSINGVLLCVFCNYCPFLYKGGPIFLFRSAKISIVFNASNYHAVASLNL